MSAVDLFLLGFFIGPQCELKEEQQLPLRWSAYDLAHFIRKNDLGELVKVSAPAVYKNLLALAGKGYLSFESNRGGRLVEKRTYSITEAGETYFRDLALRHASDPPQYHFGFNAFIVNMDKLSKDDCRAGIAALRASLEVKRDQLVSCASQFSFIPLPGRGIIRQHIALNDSMIAWLEAFAEEYGRTR